MLNPADHRKIGNISITGPAVHPDDVEPSPEAPTATARLPAAGRTEAHLPPLVFNFALASFIIAGLTGSLLRYWMWQGFPAGIQFANVRHAHSHLMYFSWVTPALMILIAGRLPQLTGRPLRPGLYISAAAALGLGIFSHLPFFFWGYAPVEIGASRLPIAVIISSLNIFTWYAFALIFRSATRGVRRTRPLRLWRFALIFLIAASAGAWSRAVLAALKIENAFLAAAAVHLFLDLFSNGWAVLGVLGLVYASRPSLVESHSGLEDPLLLAGLPLSFLLGLPVDLVPTDLRTLAGISGLLAACGLVLHIKALWPRHGGGSRSGWIAPLFFLALSAGMLAAASIAPAARWGEQSGFRIFYLHILLLGFISLGLLAGRADSDDGSHMKAYWNWMVIAVTGLLVSLLPLTGIWPDRLTGEWSLAAAFLFSLGPPLAAVGLLLRTLAAHSRRVR